MDYSKPDQYVGPAIKSKHFLPLYDLRAARPKMYKDGPLVTPKDKAVVADWLEIMRVQGHNGSSYNGVLWKVIQCLYEYSVSMQMLIFMAFWFIEFPAMGITYDLESTQGWMIFVLIIDHLGPTALILIEACHNSIEVDWHRFPLYFAINLTYLLYISIYN